MGFCVFILIIIGGSALYSILMSIGILLGGTLPDDTAVNVIIYINFITGGIAFLMFAYKALDFIYCSVRLFYKLKYKAVLVKVLKEYPNGFPKGTLIILDKKDEYLKYLEYFNHDILKIIPLEYIDTSYMPEKLQDLTTYLDKP